VPDSFNIASEALLDSEIIPATSLTLAGENEMVKLAVWPAEIVSGSVGVLSENCEVLARALVIVNESVPVLVAVSASLLVLPTATWPKLRVVLLKRKSPMEAGCCLEGVPALKPWHATRLAMAKVIIRPCQLFARFLAQWLCM